MHNLLIKQASLESGFLARTNEATATQTKVKDILIEDGIITQIADHIADSGDCTVFNAQKQLVAPSFREMHIHIDKTYFSGPWKACKPITNGIFTRIREEEELLPKQLAFAEERATAMIEHLIKHGHTHIRTHCNIDPAIGLKNLEVTVKVLEAYKDRITYDIVAFPQHGLLRSNVEGLMAEAMEIGATLVGGVDPATVDRDIDRSLEAMFRVARNANKGLDLHLHDPDSLGEFTFYKLAELTRKHHLEGKVTISHAMALGDLTGDDLTSMMNTLKDAQIDVTTTIPINRPTIPVLQLDQAGIPVSVGHDSLTDHWSPFGTGDTVEKLSILAERFKIIDEIGLSQIWKFASGGLTPLDKQGKQIWPKPGDKANMVIIDASCTAEAVSRRKDISAVISRGQIIG